ncbi:hypothetical protein ACFYWF_27920 [Streptomyces sp. NPDC003344]|uniref:hypothetical protein n=1 Tax=Streptomyces sp. NPDC003344 TaxID=3364682 RepID=UPI00369739AC
MIVTLFYAGVCVPILAWRVLATARRKSFYQFTWRKPSRLNKKKNAEREATYSQIADYAVGYLENTGATTCLSREGLSRALTTAYHSRRGSYAAFKRQVLSTMVLALPLLLISNFDPVKDKHQNPWALTYGPGLGMQISCAILALVVIFSTRTTYIARRKVDGFVNAVSDNLDCVLKVALIRSGQSMPIELDSKINSLCIELNEYALGGQMNVPEIRRQELTRHVQAVTQTLEDASRDLVTNGWTEESRILFLLNRILERLVQGRWYGLLDQEDLSERAQMAHLQADELPADLKKDQRVAMLGIVASFTVVAIATIAGAPVSVTLGLAGIAAIAPAATAGRLGMTPGSAMQQVRESLKSGSQPSEGSSEK